MGRLGAEEDPVIGRAFYRLTCRSAEVLVDDLQNFAEIPGPAM